VRKVLLDMNALIGLQSRQLKSVIGRVLQKSNNLLVITDHTILEALKNGPRNAEKIFRDLAPYRDRVRAGRLHGELYDLELAFCSPIHASHILAADGRSEHLQGILEQESRDEHPVRDLFRAEGTREEIRKRVGLRSTARILMSHYNSLDKAIAQADISFARRKKMKASIHDRFRGAKYFGKAYLSLCINLAIGTSKNDLLRLGAHEEIAEQLSKADSFAFRRSLSYWLRCLILRRNNLLKDWMRNGKIMKRRNEHFDIEFAAISSYAETIVIADNDSIEHLGLFARAMRIHLGKWHGPHIFNPHKSRRKKPTLAPKGASGV
jgi:hypothetical protein